MLTSKVRCLCSDGNMVVSGGTVQERRLAFYPANEGLAHVTRTSKSRLDTPHPCEETRKSDGLDKSSCETRQDEWHLLSEALAQTFISRRPEARCRDNSSRYIRRLRTRALRNQQG